MLPFLTKKVTHAWQVVSVCCRSSAYEEAKLVKCFQFYFFLLKREKNKQISIYAFFNQFSIVLNLMLFFTQSKLSCFFYFINFYVFFLRVFFNHLYFIFT